MKARAAEPTREGRKSAKKTNEQQATLDAIAKMAPEDRAVAEQVHATVAAAAATVAKTFLVWHACSTPTQDGKVVIYFSATRASSTSGTRTWASRTASLDDGDMWPVMFAVHKWTAAVEKS